MIDPTNFGEIVIDKKKYRDVLIINTQVFDRNTDDAHTISNNESGKLIENNPDVVIIGTGVFGGLKVEERIKEKIGKNAELIIMKTSHAAEKYNELTKNKRVNILLHSTC